MQILFLNNDGAGFADRVDVADGTTVSTFLAQRLPDRAPGDLLIRVNRQPTVADYVLRDGDRLSAKPVKIEAARAA